MEDEKKELQDSLTEDQPETESVKQIEDKVKPKGPPSDVPYYRFKEKVDDYNSLKEELERVKADIDQYKGMDINELQSLKKLQQDLGNPELLADMRQYVSNWYAKKKTSTSAPQPEIEELKRRLERVEIDKIAAQIDKNLDGLAQEFGDYDRDKLLTLVEEDGLNPTNEKHLKMCFKEYFSENITSKQKSKLEKQIKKLPEGGGIGGKPTSTLPTDIGDVYRLAKEGKLK